MAKPMLQRCSADRPPVPGAEVRVCSGSFTGMHAYVRSVNPRHGVARLVMQTFARQDNPVEVPFAELELAQTEPDSTPDPAT